MALMGRGNAGRFGHRSATRGVPAVDKSWPYTALGVTVRWLPLAVGAAIALLGILLALYLAVPHP